MSGKVKKERRQGFFVESKGLFTPAQFGSDFLNANQVQPKRSMVWTTNQRPLVGLLVRDFAREVVSVRFQTHHCEARLTRERDRNVVQTSSEIKHFYCTLQAFAATGIIVSSNNWSILAHVWICFQILGLLGKFWDFFSQQNQKKTHSILVNTP